MNTLRSYLQQANVKQAALAASLGISRSYLNELVHGGKTPGLALAIQIERVTEGGVKVGSWDSSSQNANHTTEFQEDGIRPFSETGA